MWFRLGVLSVAAWLCVSSALGQTVTPPEDPALKGHVPSFSSKYKGGNAMQPPKMAPRKAPEGRKPGEKPAVRPGLAVPKPEPKAKPEGKAKVPVTAPETVKPAVPAPAAKPVEAAGKMPAPSPTPAPTVPTTPETISPATTVAPAPEPAPEPVPTPELPGPAPATEGEIPADATDTESPPATPAVPKEAPRGAGARPTGKAAEFHAQYREFFTENTFTPELSDYWRTALTEEPERKVEIIQESAAFAAEAVVAAFATGREADEAFPGDSLNNGLGWLEQLFYEVDEANSASVVDAIDAALSEGALDLTLVLETPAQQETMRLAMQTCLTLALYGDAPALQRWLKLPERTLSFMDAAQAFLFGGNALTQENFDALVSVFKVFPRGLHQVIAVIVPEGAGLDAGTAGLNTPGIVLNISAAPNGVSSPEEFYMETRLQPVAPLFTLEAAMQVFRAVQYVQFSQRPELVERRNLILSNAGGEVTRYLRRGIPPAAYLGEPDELLPQTAYLWFIDSTAAFEQAGGLLRFKENEAMDALLLLADVISGGGDSSLEFRTDMDGKLNAREVPLQRTEVQPGLRFATGIGINGEIWSFGVDATGGVSREVAPVAYQLPEEAPGPELPVEPAPQDLAGDGAAAPTE
jgi:hypothetical protein